MNTDIALIGMLVIGALLGFALGYSKGHEHGKIQGRIARGREQRVLQQVSR
jgi:hypothetical protein